MSSSARPDLRRHPEAATLTAVLVVAALVALVGGVPGGVVGRGVVTASFLLLHATGVLLAYRSEGFVNLAQVQIGAVGGTVFALGVQARPLVRLVASVCPPCLDATAPPRVAGLVNDAAALLAGVGVAVLVAWLFGAVVVRRLSGRARLVVTVASVLLVQLLAGLREPLVRALTTEEQRAAGVPSGAVGVPLDLGFTAGGARFDATDVLVVVLAVTAVLVTAWWLRATRTGVALRAAAQRPDRARTLGVEVGRLTGRVWVAIGALSAAAAVLTVTSVGESAVGGGLQAGLLVRLLAVALLARLRHLGLAVLAALGIGVLDEVLRFVTGSSLSFDGGLLVLLSLLLLAQRDDARRADDDREDWSSYREFHPVPRALRSLPEIARWRRVWRGTACVVALGVPWVLSPSQTSLTTVAITYAIVGLSVLVLTGWAGTVSLGQFAFAAVGGWVASVTGLHPLLALPAGAIVGAVVAVAVGLPAVRLRGLHLAVTSLAFALATSAVLLSPRYLGRLLPEPGDRPTILGLDLDDQRVAYHVTLLVLLLTLAAVAGLRRSGFGRALIASRDNPAAAASMGLDLTRLRLAAFAVSGAVAALGGVLFTYHQGGVRPDAFAPELSVLVFVVAVIGGFGHPAAPLAGFVALAGLSIAAVDASLVGLVTGAGGLGLLLAEPGGLAAVAVRARDGYLRRVARRRRIAVPTLEGAEVAVARAPIRPRTRPDGGTEFVPRRYGLDRQWLVGDTDPTAGSGTGDDRAVSRV